MLQIHNTKKLLEELLLKEDSNGDKKITIADIGEKKIGIPLINGNIEYIESTYFLSNLLQELAIEINKGNDKETTISLDRIYEKPANRISRLIREKYWNDLTRKMDKEGLINILQDDKMKSEIFYVYIPYNDTIAFNYYKNISKELNIKVVSLPKKITPEYVLSINEKPGLLSLALYKDENKEIRSYPFVVPGGRFNEMFGWDSYFQSIGLLIDKKPHLIKGTLENFRYEIENYGSILTANRSYFITRSNPPFYSSMLTEYIENQNITNLLWISKMLNSVIREYETVWMSKTRLCDNGLNRYYGDGIGYVVETEEGHFREATEIYAQKFKMPIDEFEKKYINRKIDVPELDDFFVHDRSLRESGHDTSSRLVNRCANLNTVDLNALLYKYETDIAGLIKTFFENTFESSNCKSYTTNYWHNLAEQRKNRINTFLWNKKEGTFYDYDFKEKEQIEYIAPSVLFPLWAKVCTSKQAELLVKKVLPLLKCKGGIVSCSKESRGKQPKRQWDYPYGWAPHQIIVWRGLLNYGYYKEVQELVYRWLWLITKDAVDYNGTIAEKYDIVKCTHIIDVEYGNQGIDFECIPNGGFGWMNASYQLGTSILKRDLKDKLNKLIDPNVLFEFIL